MTSPRRKRVALIVETSLASGRGILRGIGRYAHESDRWSLFHVARGLREATPDWLSSWSGDGVIARVHSPELTSLLASLELPVVDVLGVVPDAPFPRVHVDEGAIASEAFSHFRERGFNHFAFYGISDENWSPRRRDSFLAASGGQASVFEAPHEEDQASIESMSRLRVWLRNLPKPCSILVASDNRGLILLETCRSEGILVPEELAVLGVDNDQTLCEISSPPLSSIRAGHDRVGYEAARLLDQMMNGASREKIADPILVPPTGTVIRGSSDTLAIGDPVVARGISYMREHLGESLTNERIAKACGVSRTLFQQRFRAAMNQSVREHLIGMRLRRAKLLVESSQLTLADIAERCGFRHQEYLGEVFRRHFGVSPGRLRRSRQGS